MSVLQLVLLSSSTVVDLGFWKGGFIFSSCQVQGSGPAADKVHVFKSMQSNEIQHNSAINMMTVGVATTLLKIPELWIQTRFKMIYCAKGN